MSPAPWTPDPFPSSQQILTVSTDGSLNMANGCGYVPTPDRTWPSFRRRATRSSAVSHPPVDAPLCAECTALEMTFVDPKCAGCRRELETHGEDNDEDDTAVAQVFAVLRQWVPQVQQSVEYLIGLCLSLGAHPDDRDALTDMTLLMYACKAGASGVGNTDSAARVADLLLSAGADSALTCKWTDMAAVHYAAFFDVAPVLKRLLLHTKGADVDLPCSEHEDGSPLHLAAASLSLEAAKVLIAFGADRTLKDALCRTPFDCVPEEEDCAGGLIPDAADRIHHISNLLRESSFAENKENKPRQRKASSGGGSTSNNAVSGRTMMQAMGIKVGDRVLVSGSKLGTLRYFGTVHFSTGVWAGVALDDPDGKNDGVVDGTEYFACEPNHGIFVQQAKIVKVGRESRSLSSSNSSAATSSSARPSVHVGTVDVSGVSSRLTACLAAIEDRNEIKLGDRVRVRDFGDGAVKYIGPVKFADDPEAKWLGVELDEPLGRHDGSVLGERYFDARDKCGVFVTEANVTKIVERKAGTSRDSKSHSKEDLAVSGTSSTKVVSRRSSVRDTPERTVRGVTVQRRASLSVKQAPKKDELSTTKLSSPSSGDISKKSAASTTTTSPAKRSPVVNVKKEDGWQTVGTIEVSKFKKNLPKKYLQVGDSVICIHNKAMGVVRFVGRVSFSSGVWVGLELRDPTGRHDGIVDGVRYFTCKPKHGTMVRPSLISVHGINGEKLLRPEADYHI